MSTGGRAIWAMQISEPWRPGQSGNLNGRPVGSRSTFSAGFTRDLAEVWAEKGKAPDGRLSFIRLLME